MLNINYPQNRVQQLQHTFTEATAPIGSLIIFDPYGFHSKKKCLEERRVLYLEFNKQENVKNNKELQWEAILLPSNHLTPKVISNINLFVNNNVVFKDKPTPLPLKASLLEIKKSGKSLLPIYGKLGEIYLFLKI